MKAAQKELIAKIEDLNNFASFLCHNRLSDKIALPTYPDCPGVYVLSSDADEILYVGQSKQLCRRVSHLTALQRDKSNKAGRSHIKADQVRQHQQNFGKVFVSFLETSSEAEARILEKKILDVIKKQWNVR